MSGVRFVGNTTQQDTGEGIVVIASMLKYRQRPLPLWYRRALLALAAFVGRRVQALRAHVKRHTPVRTVRMTATRVLRDQQRFGGTD